MLILIIYLYK